MYITKAIVKNTSIKMAFHGKKWKKTAFENTEEFMDKLEVPEKTRALFRQTDSVSTFLKNDDGTIQYVVSLGDKKLIDQKIVLGEQTDYKTPDGIDTKNTFTLEGDTLKLVMVFPNGKELHMDRVFEADKLVLKIWMEGIDIKASVTYQSV